MEFKEESLSGAGGPGGRVTEALGEEGHRDNDSRGGEAAMALPAASRREKGRRR